jgi:hypothetical protein
VIFLILYIFIIWQDEDNELSQQDDIHFIPKYKIVNKINIKDDNSAESQDFQQKTQNNLQPEHIIKSKYKSKYIKENSSNKFENSNIFVPQKNKAKFGIKF